MPFDYALDFDTTDFREHPELYRIGRGEQGVLSAQPYKAEILPYWRFATVEAAQASAEKIYALFGEYKAKEDFVGMDMARKFLQMGYTRARRYANHPSGRKYEHKAEESPSLRQEIDSQAAADPHPPHLEEHPHAGEDVLPQAADWATSEKARAARVFYGYYEQAKDDPEYVRLKQRHIERYGK